MFDTHSSGAGGSASVRTTRLDVNSLGVTIQQLLQAGLAPSTQCTYLARKRKYLNLCQQSRLSLLPASEMQLIQFIVFTVNQKLKDQTIKSYLSVVCHYQVSCGGRDPRVGDMPQVVLMLCGVKKEQAGMPKHPCLPITLAILRALWQTWDKDASRWDNIML